MSHSVSSSFFQSLSFISLQEVIMSAGVNPSTLQEHTVTHESHVRVKLKALLHTNCTQQCINHSNEDLQRFTRSEKYRIACITEHSIVYSVVKMYFRDFWGFRLSRNCQNMTMIIIYMSSESAEGQGLATKLGLVITDYNYKHYNYILS